MKMLNAILFFLTLSSCATASKSSSQVSALDINRINELYRIQGAVAKDVWTGFEGAMFRFILIEDKNQYAFNVDPLPEYYKPIAIPAGLSKEVTSVAVTEKFRNEVGEKLTEPPAALYAAYSKEMTNDHFKHSVFLVKSLDEFHRIGDKQSAETWIHISLHELFHTYQDSLVKYDAVLLKAIMTPPKREITNDEKHKRLLKPEVELLGRAACSSSIAEAKKNLKKALKLRKKRWAYLEKIYHFKPQQWERFDSWAEGTAHYVEHEIMSKITFYKEGTFLKGDPFYDQFQEYQTESQQAWCDRITSNTKRSYWYTLGFAYALILDKLQPSWKSLPVNSQLFFDAYFKKINLL